MSRFRFEDLDIWKESADLYDFLFDTCKDLEQAHLYRFAEQLRGASLSVSNNIAEGSGSNSKREFIQFLNIARRSCFEVANIVILFDRKNLLKTDIKEALLEKIDRICRKITNFQRSLQNR